MVLHAKFRATKPSIFLEVTQRDLQALALPGQTAPLTVNKGLSHYPTAHPPRGQLKPDGQQRGASCQDRPDAALLEACSHHER